MNTEQRAEQHGDNCHPERQEIDTREKREQISMDEVNRYLYRSSGEKQHQPLTAAEARAFAVVDGLRRFDWFENKFESMSQEEMSQLFCDLIDRDTRVSGRYEVLPPVQSLPNQQPWFWFVFGVICSSIGWYFG